MQLDDFDGLRIGPDTERKIRLTLVPRGNRLLLGKEFYFASYRMKQFPDADNVRQALGSSRHLFDSLAAGHQSPKDSICSEAGSDSCSHSKFF